jgi:hypothetical protein
VCDAYQAVSGNRIEILDFILAAFLAGYPVFARRGPIVAPRKKPSTYFDFGFDARDVKNQETQED